MGREIGPFVETAQQLGFENLFFDSYGPVGIISAVQEHLPAIRVPDRLLSSRTPPPRRSWLQILATEDLNSLGEDWRCSAQSSTECLPGKTLSADQSGSRNASDHE